MTKTSIFRLATIIILILIITALHYLTDTHHDKAHDVYRRLYYIPIVLGGLWFTLRGGLGTALIATILYVPHVVFQWGNHPNMDLEQYLEIVLYNGIGFLTGFLTLRERQQTIRYQWTAENLEKSYHKLRDQADQIIEIEEQLRRADRLSALGELSAGMAHEIRNPLGSIKGTAEILKENVPREDPRYEFAEILVQEVDRLNHVLEDFLTFAKPVSLERTWIDINNIVKNVLDLTRQQALKNKINVTFQSSDLPKIPGHTEQIKQALLNIILNALQVMNDGGDLDVATSLDDGYARVKITDTGPGVAPKDRDRIFNPFVTTRSDGTGLGLSITQRIIHGHGGRIELTSELGHGTTFTVSLPFK